MTKCNIAEGRKLCLIWHIWNMCNYIDSDVQVENRWQVYEQKAWLHGQQTLRTESICPAFIWLGLPGSSKGLYWPLQLWRSLVLEMPFPQLDPKGIFIFGEGADLEPVLVGHRPNNWKISPYPGREQSYVKSWASHHMFVGSWVELGMEAVSGSSLNSRA